MYFQPLPIHMNHLYIYHLGSIRSWFGKRGYPKKLVGNQLRRVVENRPEKLPEHQKKKQKKNTELVCHLWLHTILGFMIYVRSLRKTLSIYMMNNKSNRSLHRPHLCHFDQALVLGIT